MIDEDEEEECEPCKLSAGVQVSLQICKQEEGPENEGYCDVLLHQVLNGQIGAFGLVDTLIDRYSNNPGVIEQLNEIKRLMKTKGR